jgi:hypothetical protein
MGRGRVRPYGAFSPAATGRCVNPKGLAPGACGGGLDTAAAAGTTASPARRAGPRQPRAARWELPSRGEGSSLPGCGKSPRVVRLPGKRVGEVGRRLPSRGPAAPRRGGAHMTATDRRLRAKNDRASPTRREAQTGGADAGEARRARPGGRGPGGRGPGCEADAGRRPLMSGADAGGARTGEGQTGARPARARRDAGLVGVRCGPAHRRSVSPVVVPARGQGPRRRTAPSRTEDGGIG